MKKNKPIKFCILFLIFCLSLFSSGCRKTQNETCRLVVSFFITDQDGIPIRDAEILFKSSGLKIRTREDGTSENVVLTVDAAECKDGWYGTTIVLNAENKVPVAVFNFVLYPDEARRAEFLLLNDDGTLPYCAYVEIPSDETIRRIMVS